MRREGEALYIWSLLGFLLGKYLETRNGHTPFRFFCDARHIFESRALEDRSVRQMFPPLADPTLRARTRADTSAVD
jgi:hypothetical protein